MSDKSASTPVRGIPENFAESAEPNKLLLFLQQLLRDPLVKEAAKIAISWSHLSRVRWPFTLRTAKEVRKEKQWFEITELIH